MTSTTPEHQPLRRVGGELQPRSTRAKMHNGMLKCFVRHEPRENFVVHTRTFALVLMLLRTPMTATRG